MWDLVIPVLVVDDGNVHSDLRSDQETLIASMITQAGVLRCRLSLYIHIVWHGCYATMYALLPIRLCVCVYEESAWRWSGAIRARR